MIAVIDAPHTDRAVVDFVRQRPLQQTLDLYVPDRAALHRQQVVLLVDPAPIDDYAQLFPENQVQLDAQNRVTSFFKRLSARIVTTYRT